MQLAAGLAAPSSPSSIPMASTSFPASSQPVSALSLLSGTFHQPVADTFSGDSKTPRVTVFRSKWSFGSLVRNSHTSQGSAAASSQLVFDGSDFADWEQRPRSSCHGA